MGRRCHNCLCRTCLNTCCNRKNCTGKKKTCENYSGFGQISIFEQPTKPRYQSAPRHSWEYYGISKERYRQLTEYIRSGRYAFMVRQAAHKANKDIEEYLLLSVTQNKSYDVFRAKWELKEMEQIPYCRTDFYGYRRYVMHLFNLEMKKIGK